MAWRITAATTDANGSEGERAISLFSGATRSGEISGDFLDGVATADLFFSGVEPGFLFESRDRNFRRAGDGSEVFAGSVEGGDSGDEEVEIL